MKYCYRSSLRHSTLFGELTLILPTQNLSQCFTIKNLGGGGIDGYVLVPLQNKQLEKEKLRPYPKFVGLNVCFWCS